MGQSMHVVGERDNTEQWTKMRDAYWACKDAGIKIPTEVLEFFDYNEPGSEAEKGRTEVELPRDAVEEINDSDLSHEGYRVDLSKIPEGVSHIRFFIGY